MYVVLSRAGNLPAYTVRPEKNVHVPTRTLRDLLLPCGFLSVDTHNDLPEPSPDCRPVTRSRRQAEPSTELLDDDERDFSYLAT